MGEAEVIQEYRQRGYQIIRTYSTPEGERRAVVLMPGGFVGQEQVIVTQSPNPSEAGMIVSGYIPPGASRLSTPELSYVLQKEQQAKAMKPVYEGYATQRVTNSISPPINITQEETYATSNKTGIREKVSGIFTRTFGTMPKIYPSGLSQEQKQELGSTNLKPKRAYELGLLSQETLRMKQEASERESDQYHAAGFTVTYGEPQELESVQPKSYLGLFKQSVSQKISPIQKKVYESYQKYAPKSVQKELSAAWGATKATPGLIKQTFMMPIKAADTAFSPIFSKVTTPISKYVSREYKPTKYTTTLFSESKGFTRTESGFQKGVKQFFASEIKSFGEKPATYTGKVLVTYGIGKGIGMIGFKTSTPIFKASYPITSKFIIPSAKVGLTSFYAYSVTKGATISYATGGVPSVTSYALGEAKTLGLLGAGAKRGALEQKARFEQQWVLKEFGKFGKVDTLDSVKAKPILSKVTLKPIALQKEVSRVIQGKKYTSIFEVVAKGEYTTPYMLKPKTFTLKGYSTITGKIGGKKSTALFDFGLKSFKSNVKVKGLETIYSKRVTLVPEPGLYISKKGLFSKGLVQSSTAKTNIGRTLSGEIYKRTIYTKPSLFETSGISLKGRLSSQVLKPRIPKGYKLEMYKGYSASRSEGVGFGGGKTYILLMKEGYTPKPQSTKPSFYYSQPTQVSKVSTAKLGITPQTLTTSISKSLNLIAPKSPKPITPFFTGQILRQTTKTSQRQVIRPAERQVIRPAERQVIRPAERQVIRPAERQVIRPSSTSQFKISTPKIPKLLTPPSSDISWRNMFGRSKTVFKVSRTTAKYKPSLIAIAGRIKGTLPSKITGLEVRPIISDRQYKTLKRTKRKLKRKR